MPKAKAPVLPPPVIPAWKEDGEPAEMVYMQIRLPRSEREKLRKLAYNQRRSLNAAARLAIVEGLKFVGAQRSYPGLTPGRKALIDAVAAKQKREAQS